MRLYFLDKNGQKSYLDKILLVGIDTGQTNYITFDIEYILNNLKNKDVFYYKDNIYNYYPQRGRFYNNYEIKFEKEGNKLKIYTKEYITFTEDIGYEEIDTGLWQSVEGAEEIIKEDKDWILDGIYYIEE